ncbi:MAG: sigma-54-dependent Fis family transcriptional regulator [Bdellovibrio sp.]|nr:MAG: sigma-54-dependent Fis family transcriptional regulator [Bdellovibrio sp.]
MRFLKKEQKAGGVLMEWSLDYSVTHRKLPISSQQSSGVFMEEAQQSSRKKRFRNLHVLVVDDDADVRQLLRICLEKEGLRVKEAGSFDELKSQVQAYSFDAALVDVYLGEDNGLDVLTYLIREAPYTKVFIMTGHESISLAVEAMEKGATSFLPKSLGPLNMIRTFLEKYEFPPVGGDENVLPYGRAFIPQGLVGQSPSMRQILDQIEQMKDADSTVLIWGESGTGKELIARALHQNSLRRSGRLEAINCGAIPENLLESELFGYKKGSFTDAKRDKKGLFEVCSDGTLVLDEIGEMPLSLQVKLLRVLQEKEVRAIGASETVQVNTRVIAVTNKNLMEEVEKGAFRQDLYFRLSVLQIEVPSLRKRSEDIPLLVQHFIDKYNRQFGKNVRVPGHELMSRLKAYHWPGNIRELQNSIERAVVLSRDGEIHLEHIFCHAKPSSSHEKGGDGQFLRTLPFSHDEAKRLFERNYLEKLLREAKGNISKAARLAGKHRVEIYRLMEKHNVKKEDFLD